LTEGFLSMPLPRAFAALPILLLWIVGAVPAAAATPGEVSTFGIASPCQAARIGAASGEGVLVRQCERAATAETAPLGNLLPSGRMVGLANLESPAGPLLAGPNGEVWAATNAGGYSKEAVAIARISTDGIVQRFPLPEQMTGYDTKPEVRDMVIGKEGALWAAIAYGGTENLEWYLSVGGELVRISPDGTMTEFPTPAGIEPLGLALGAEGNLWFTAISELSASEHTYHAGTGHIGRMTPSGEVKVMQTPVAHTDPGAIAAAPDGTLWFAENGSIGTVSPDGAFGPSYESLSGSNRSLVFGPEGDLWAAGAGLVRVTPTGQRTAFGLGAGDVVVGPEGDIWVASYNSVSRLTPGAPGLDVWGLEANPKSGTARAKLACGGSSSACEGTLEITLSRVTRASGAKKSKPKHSTYRVVQRHYRVPAESSRTLRFKLAAPALAIVRRSAREHRAAGPTATIGATVTGGPAMHRKPELRLRAARPQES
jgi:streptogramin lyase